MNRLTPGPLSVSDYIDRRIHIDSQPEELSTVERMEELLAKLANEATAEASPETAERYAAAVMFVATGLRGIRKLRSEAWL
jgi:hypothetical protein